MPSASPFEKNVVGGVPLSHLVMKSGLVHKRIGIFRLTFHFKGLIPFWLPFQGDRFWLAFQWRRDHHQQSRPKEQKQHETTGVGMPEGLFGESQWGSVKNQTKHKQGCPVTSSSKTAGRQQGASVPRWVLPWARRGPAPALSSLLAQEQQLPDEKLVWGGCFCLQSPGTGRIDQ